MATENNVPHPPIIDVATNFAPLDFRERRGFIILGDVLVTLLATVTSVAWWEWKDMSRVSLIWLHGRGAWIFILGVLWLLNLGISGAYSIPYVWRSRPFLPLLLTPVLTIFEYVTIYFLAPRTLLPRLVTLVFILVAWLCTLGWRYLWAHLSSSILQRPILIVGTNVLARSLAAHLLKNRQAGYRIVGFVATQGDPGFRTISVKVGESQTVVPVFSYLNELISVAHRFRIMEIVVASDIPISKQFLEVLIELYTRGFLLTHAVEMEETLTGRVSLDFLNGNPWTLFTIRPSAGQVINMAVKRVMDIAGAILGLGFFLFLLPILAPLIYIDSPGPIFYHQIRVGKGGRPFTIWKLRTMYPNAEAHGQAVWAQEGDPRITRVGRWLRKSRIDEIPQFWNVLKGEMSLVGPRPERPELMALLRKKIPLYSLRLAVKPGIAGWATVHFDYVDSLEDAKIRLEYDLYYIKHQSIWLDIQILIQSVLKALLLKGR